MNKRINERCAVVVLKKESGIILFALLEVLFLFRELLSNKKLEKCLKSKGTVGIHK